MIQRIDRFQSNLLTVLVSISLLLLSPFVGAEDIYGKVVGVTDGDTLTILTEDRRQAKIRIAGIDAPEKGQPYSQAAKQRLAAMVMAQTVLVSSHKIDRYGRKVAVVFSNRQDVGLRMV